MIGTNFQTVAVGKPYVLLVFLVDSVASLRSFYIDIGHLGVVADMLPEHLALIVTNVDTMDMCTCVFTKHIIVLGTQRGGCDRKDT